MKRQDLFFFLWHRFYIPFNKRFSSRNVVICAMHFFWNRLHEHVQSSIKDSSKSLPPAESRNTLVISTLDLWSFLCMGTMRPKLQRILGIYKHLRLQHRVTSNSCQTCPLAEALYRWKTYHSSNWVQVEECDPRKHVRLALHFCVYVLGDH